MLALSQVSKEQRAASFKADEHVCLTEPKECCRLTACKIREYHRKLSLGPTNRVPEIDDTPADRAKEQMKQYFRPRNDPS